MSVCLFCCFSIRFQEICLGCEARNEFTYYIDGEQIAYSLDDSYFLLRWCCRECYPSYTRINSISIPTGEMLAVDRPCRFMACCCKCCSHQQITVTSGGLTLGTAKEDFYICLPTFTIFDDKGRAVYKVHPPSCWAGQCMNVRPCVRVCVRACLSCVM